MTLSEIHEIAHRCIGPDIDYKMLLRVLIVGFTAVAHAQIGQQHRNDVDRAMDGWDQLRNNPDKMQELWQSFKDPEVVAKAQEMLQDPVYMAAAKKKLSEMQQQARAQGLLDSSGNPLPGAAQALASQGGVPAELAAQIMGGGAGSAPAGGAREWELENLERHRAGELNDAELATANLQRSMNDPSMMREMAELLKDPANVQQLKQMMADPTFQQQAKAAAIKMQQDGTMPDLAQMAQALGARAGGGAAAPDAGAAEIARLRRENAALKQARGLA